MEKNGNRNDLCEVWIRDNILSVIGELQGRKLPSYVVILWRPISIEACALQLIEHERIQAGHRKIGVKLGFSHGYGYDGLSMPRLSGERIWNATAKVKEEIALMDEVARNTHWHRGSTWPGYFIACLGEGSLKKASDRFGLGLCGRQLNLLSCEEVGEMGRMGKTFYKVVAT